MAALQVEDLIVESASGGPRYRVTVDAEEGKVVGVEVESPPVGRLLARTIAGLAAPVSGRVLANGRDVTGKPGRDVGYVPAGGGLLPHRSLADNLTYLRDAREQIRGLVDGAVARLTSDLELLSALPRLPHEATPSERLRTAVARAVLHDRTVLVVEVPEADAAALPDPTVFADVQLPAGDALAVLVFSDDAALLGRLDRRVAVVELPAA